MSDSTPTAECVKGTMFEDCVSDEQLALPVGERYSLSDAQIYGVRALVSYCSEKDARIAALRAENARLRDFALRVECLPDSHGAVAWAHDAARRVLKEATP